MEDPKRQAWMYLVAGVVAVVASGYFLSTPNQANGTFAWLDWAILGMGVVALYRGITGFLELRHGGTGSVPPTDGAAIPKRISRPGQRPSGNEDTPEGSKES